MCIYIYIMMWLNAPCILGTITSHELELDEVTEDDGGAVDGTRMHEVTYKDGDIDLLNLQTLDFQSMVSRDARQSLRRLCWMLHSQEPKFAGHISKALQLCLGVPVSEQHEPQQARKEQVHKRQHTETTEAQRPGSKSKPDQGLSENEQSNPKRSRRNVGKPQAFSFEREGKNDKARRGDPSC